MAFVGRERVEIVRDLRALFDLAVSESAPYLASLEAEAGWGKTRIVQELYAELQRTRQRGQRYWPTDLVPRGEDPMLGRKLVHPENPCPEPGAEMPWLWWGLRCERGSGGRLIRAVHSDRVQLRAHTNALVSAASRRKQDQEIALEVLGTVLGALPAIGQFIGATDAARRLAPKLRRRLQEGIERRAGRRAPDAGRMETGGTLSLSEIEPELELVARLITPELPLVLVVDDAHHADSDTVAFVRELMKLRVPALVITTAWPSALEDQRAEESSLCAADRRTFGGFLDGLEAERHDQLWRFRLRRLADGALVSLIDEIAADTTADRQAALLKTSDGNPLVLSLQLTSRKVARSIHEGAIGLPVAELARLPRAFEALIAERFMELPAAEQTWLAEAAWHGAEFFPDFLSTSMENLDRERLGGFVRVVPDDGVPAARFIESAVHAATAVASEDEFTNDEREEWSAAALERITIWWRSERKLPQGLQARAELCRLVVRVCEGADTLPADVAVGAAMHLSWAERDMGQHPAELEAAERAVAFAERASDPNFRLEARARTRLASALSANNAYESAAEAARRADATLTADVPASEAWDTLYVLTHALLNNGEYSDAGEAAERASGLDLDVDQRIDSLRLRASVDDEMNQLPRAASLIGEALALAHAAKPHDAELLIDLETDLLDLDPFMGNAPRWRELAAHAASTLGRGHYLYRYCLMSAANALMFAADTPAAMEVLAELAELAPTDETDEASPMEQMLHAMAEGPQALAVFFPQLAHTPYSSRLDETAMSSIGTLLDMGLGRQPATTAPLAEGAPDSALTCVATDRSTDVAIERFHEFLVDGGGTADHGLVTTLSVAANLLARHLYETREPHPRMDAILDHLAPFAAQEKVPLLVRRRFSGVVDARSILAGGDPEALASVRGDEASVVNNIALRGIAWTLCGRRDRAEHEIDAAQRILDASDSPDRVLLRAVAEAAAAAELPGAEDRWRRIVERGAVDARDALADRVGFAACLFGLKRHEEARELLERVVEEQGRLVGEDHPSTLSAKHSLAVVLHDLGDLAASRALKEEVLSARRAGMGEEHPDTMRAKRELANTAYAMGDYADARVLEQQVMAARRAALGEEHPDTIRAKRNLAVTLYAMGDYADARVLEEQVLGARRAALGEEHPDTIRAKLSLAVTLHELGDRAASRVLKDQVLSARTAALGDEHPDTIDAKHTLAVTLHELGELAAARGLYEEVLSARQGSLGEEHPDTLRVKADLGVTLYALGEHAHERVLEEQVLSTRRAALGEEHPDTIRAKRNLAITLHAMGEYADARVLGEEVLAARREALGEEHPDTMRAKRDLAVTLHSLASADADLDDLERAKAGFERALGIRKDVLGAEHTDTAFTLHRLGWIRHRLGDDVAAEADLQEALAIIQERRGEDDQHIGAILHNLGSVVAAQGDLERAAKTLEWALAANHAQPDQPTTEAILADLRAILARTGDERVEALPPRRVSHSISALVAEQQRWLFALRRHVLEGADIRSAMQPILPEILYAVLRDHELGDEAGRLACRQRLAEMCPIEADIESLYDLASPCTTQPLCDHLVEVWERREDELGEELIRAVERFVLLQMIDQGWPKHRAALIKRFEDAPPTESGAAWAARRLIIAVWAPFSSMFFNLDVEEVDESNAPSEGKGEA